MLQQIFDHKHAEVATAKAERPIAALRREAESTPRPRGFLKALQTADRPLALVAEVKKASPSQGLIRPNFDPIEVARAYESAGVHALSVLTDSKYFGGSPEVLRTVRQTTELPLLRKDFIDDEYQLFEARAWGADAVLLIVAALDDTRLRDLFAASTALGLDVLVEVHNDAETDRALALEAPLIGVNNRDLATFKTDLATSERLIPRLATHAFAISESALEAKADLDRVQAAGAKGVLIGTSFCASPNIEAKVREVMGWPKPVPAEA
jgi:indole-3-glycerol phosphate synthase